MAADNKADTQEDFRAPWKEWARLYKDSPRATFRDVLQFEAEVRRLAEALGKGAVRLFDVGCGNGATLVGLLRQGVEPTAIGGCDLLEEFVATANETLAGGRFFRLDLSDMDDPHWGELAAFAPDAAYTKRVLCNLSGRRAQRAALKRVCDLLPPGGRILLIEPFWEGLQNLNRLRAVFGLPPLHEPDFNEYLRWKDVEHVLVEAGFTDIVRQDYSSAYYVGSRVLQPYFWPNDEPSYDHPINHYFMENVPNREGFGLHWFVQAKKAPAGR